MPLINSKNKLTVARKVGFVEQHSKLLAVEEQLYDVVMVELG